MIGGECVPSKDLSHDDRKHLNDIFFKQKNVEIARSICGRCPVNVPCLIEAMGLEEKSLPYRFGVRGGKTPKERSDLARIPNWLQSL